MKKLAKILVLVLSVALLVGALLIVASAAEPDRLTWTEEKVIKVYHTESSAKYLADKEDGVFDQHDEEFNVLADAMAYAANHCAKGKPAYVVLADDFNEGTSYFTPGEESIYKGTTSLVGSVVTLDLNGHDLNLLVNRFLKTGSSSGSAGSSQRFQINGASDITIVGNGGTLRVAANMFQVTSGGGKLTFDGSGDGLTVVAAKGYTYEFGNKKFTANTTFPGGEGIVKGFRNASQSTTETNINIVGDVNYVRENSGCTAFVDMVHNRGSFNVNFGTAVADATVRDTTVFTATDMSGKIDGSGLILRHNDDTKADTDPANYEIKGTVNINNATIIAGDFKFFDLHNGKYSDATDGDTITYNIKNSTLRLDARSDSSRSAVHAFTIKCNIPFRFNIEGSEIYDDNSIFSGDVTPTPGQIKTLIQIKNSYISVVNAAGKLTTLSQRTGTMIIENSFLNVGAIANKDIYWIDYKNDKGEVNTYIDGSAVSWPVYAEEVGGYGVYLKDGNYLSNVDNKGNAAAAKKKPGQYSDAGWGSNKFGSNGDGKTYIEIVPGKGIWSKVDDKDSSTFNIGGIYTCNGTVGASVSDFSSAFTTAFAGYTFCVGNSNTTARPGKFTIASNPVVDDANTYVIHTYHEGTDGVKYSHTQPYSYFAVNNTFSASTAANYKITDYAYYTIDLDLMTREDKFTKNFNPQFFIRSYVDSGSTQGGAYIVMNEDGVWNSPLSDDSYAMDYTPGVWQHITLVLEMPMGTDGKVDYLKIYDEAKIHLYIDGTYAHTFTNVIASNTFAVAENFKANGQYAGVAEVRVSYDGSDQNGCGNAETAVDNVAFVRYTTAADKTLDEMGAYIYNSYADMLIERPTNVPFATYKLGDKYITAGHESISEYIVNALFGEPFQEYTLHTDAKGVIDLDAIAQGYEIETFDELVETLTEDGTFSFSIKTNGYDLKFSENGYVEEYDEATKTLTFRTPVEEDYVKIYFDDLDPATANESIKALPGKTVKADAFPAYETVEKATEYAKLYFSGWTTTLGQAAIAEIAVGNEDITLVPGVKTVSTLGDIFFNVSANDNTALNYYIPVEWYLDATGEEDIIPGFKIIAIQNQREGKDASAFSVMDPTGKNKGEYVKHSYNGQDYYCFTSYPEIANVDKTLSFIITYEFTYEGVTFTASATYVTSALDYCERVFAGNYTAAEKEIAANYLRYTYEYVKALTVLNPTNEAYAASLARIEAVYTDAAKAYCTEYETDVLADKGDKDLAELEAYIAEGGFKINGTRFNLQLSFKENTKVKGVQITTYGIASDLDKALANNTFEAGYKTIVVGSHSTQMKVDDNGYYTYYNTANFVPYNMFETITIVLTIDDGTEAGKQVVGTYSLAAYYNDLVAAGTDAEVLEAYANVFCATKELGDSVVAYRFEEVK